MEPGIAALRADRGSVVDPIVRLDFREVIVEAPAPLHGGGVEDPDAAACLVDGHPPVVPLVRQSGQGLLQKFSVGTSPADRRDPCGNRVQLTGGLVFFVPSVEVLPVEVRSQRVATGG